jgi:DNA-binding NarL/FixJ family response regulator
MNVIKIFIVDDHPVVRRGLKSLLSNYDDFEVVGEAGDVDTAVNSLCHVNTDVVLLDIRLPGKSGLVLLEWIQERQSHIKVLILTSFDDDEYVMRALRGGAFGFILKSDSDETLCGAIRAIYRDGLVLNPQVTEYIVQNLAEASSIDDEFSEEELKILHLLVDGANNDDIATELYMSVASVKRRLQKIFAKLNVTNRSRAIAETVRRNLLSDSI